MDPSQDVTDTTISENGTMPTPSLHPATTALLTGAYVVIIAAGMVSVFLSRVNWWLSLGILLLCLGITFTLHQMTKKRFPLTSTSPMWPHVTDSTTDTAPPWPHSV